MKTLSVAKDFSRYPAGRVVTDGPHTGEHFRVMLEEHLREGQLTVNMDGTFGYGSSFLEEAFGGLVRRCGFSVDALHKLLSIESADPSVSLEVWSYIDSAKPDAK